MKIAMVASEANPFAKTGGLGDVVYSLAKELTILGEEVVIVLPFYAAIKDKLDTMPGELTSYFVSMSWRKEKATIYRTYVDGITYYLIENEHYFGRRVMYGEYDDGERFAFFTLASAALFSNVNFKPDIINVHDWQAGMLPVLLKEKGSDFEYLKDTKTVLTIHNPAFQGLFPKTILGDFYGLPDSLFDSGKVRFNDEVSTLKSAIVYADKIVTVSPTHAAELLTNDGGKGLDSVLRLRQYDFAGILNGVDYLEFNPETDDYIYANYNVDTLKVGKDKNKAALLHSMHLKETGKPLIGFVSRLSWQKGTDLIFAMAYDLANKGCNLVILGSGEYQMEQQLEKLRATYPETVGIYIGYNDELAHKIYAASDFFLMPSLFEPCGISQMIAQRYGTLPIVRRTGGLKDSVICYDGTNDDVANGFGFDEYDPAQAVKVGDFAYETWYKLDIRKKLMKNAMLTDNTWRKSALKYLEIYHSLVPEDK